MSDTPLSKPARYAGFQLTTDRMVVNILVMITIGVFIIAIAVAIGGDIPVAWSLAISAFITAGATILARRGFTTPGRVLVPLLLTLVIALIAYNRGGLHQISVSGFPIIIILAGLLLGTRGSFVFALLASITAIILGYADLNGISPFSATSRTAYDDLVVAPALFFITAGLLRVIIQRLTDSLKKAEANTRAQEETNIKLQELQKELEQRVNQRTNELQGKVTQLQTISQVSQTISGIEKLEDLLPRIAELISHRFEIYHTGIFLVDDRGENAVLRAANSVGGQNMLAHGHRLKVGRQGIVGNVTSTGRPRIALDVGADAVYFDNPDLPDTRSEIALPLKIAGQTFGALDLQSKQANAFGEEDLQTLSILADQVAIAIQNARLFEQSRQAAEEAEKAYRQMTGRTWRQATAQSKVLGYEYDGAMSKPVSYVSNDESSLSIPLLLRGQAIGNLKLSALDPDRNWTDDELAMAQATAERTALTLESARLLEDAQRRAAMEQAIGEITASISTSSDVDTILRTTVQELGNKIGNTEVIFELSANPDAQEHI